MPPTHRAQTLKQARAEYKSRHQAPLTERERRQIERSVELERRAGRAREAEKRRVEARTKREVAGKREREAGGATRAAVQGRRCDRYGFVGSQMCLGGFLGGGAGEGEVEEMEVARRTGRQDDGEDLALFLDELDSSTQIARDLATEPSLMVREAENAEDPPRAGNRSTGSSFGSEDFDLSVEEIEAAQAAGTREAGEELDKGLMPPPALPVQAPILAHPPRRPPSGGHLMPPPPLPATSRAPARVQSLPTCAREGRSPSRAALSFPPHLGFTLAELEGFVEEDLQLTQVESGG